MNGQSTTNADYLHYKTQSLVKFDSARYERLSRAAGLLRKAQTREMA